MPCLTRLAFCLPLPPQLRGTRGTLSDVGGGGGAAAVQLGVPSEPFTFESHAKARGVRVATASLSGELAGRRSRRHCGVKAPDTWHATAVGGVELPMLSGCPRCLAVWLAAAVDKGGATEVEAFIRRCVPA